MRTRKTLSMFVILCLITLQTAIPSIAATTGSAIDINTNHTLHQWIAHQFKALDESTANAVATKIIKRNNNKLHYNLTDESANALLSQTEATEKFKKIKTIDLTNLGLTSVEGIQAFDQVTMLNLAKNKLSELPNIRNLTKLKKLRLAKNVFTEIPKNLPDNLLFLGLGNNSITDITNYEQLPNLEVLYMHYNYVEAIPSDIFVKMPKLALFEIYGNLLKDVPQTVQDGFNRIAHDGTLSAARDKWALYIKDVQAGKRKGGFPDVGTYKQVNVKDNGIVGDTADETYAIELFELLSKYDTADNGNLVKKENRYYIIPATEDNAKIIKDAVSKGIANAKSDMLSLAKKINTGDLDAFLLDPANYQSSNAPYSLALKNNAVSGAGNYWLVALTPNYQREVLTQTYLKNNKAYKIHQEIDQFLGSIYGFSFAIDPVIKLEPIKDTDDKITAHTEPNSTVDFYVDGKLIGTSTSDDTGLVTLATTPLDGGQKVTATVTVQTLSASDTTLVTDNTKPTVDIQDTVYADDSLVSVSSENGATITLFLNGAKIGEATITDGTSIKFAVSGLKKDDELSAIATDRAGNVSNNDRTIVLDNAPESETTTQTESKTTIETTTETTQSESETSTTSSESTTESETTIENTTESSSSETETTNSTAETETTTVETTTVETTTVEPTTETQNNTRPARVVVNRNQATPIRLGVDQPVEGVIELADGEVPLAAVEPQFGELDVKPDGSFTYTPNEDFVGKDSFIVNIDDNNPDTVDEAITIEVEIDPLNIPMNSPILPKTAEQFPLLALLLSAILMGIGYTINRKFK